MKTKDLHLLYLIKHRMTLLAITQIYHNLLLINIYKLVELIPDNKKLLITNQ